MKIATIGAGHIGGNLARRFAAAGHDVVIANSRGPETLADLAAETGATAVPASQAARGADVLVVTIPLRNVAELPDDLLADAKDDLVVIDTNNYYPQRDGRIAGIEDDGLTEARWVSQQLGHAVVKAFNGIYAQHILDAGRPAADPERRGLPIAGDDPPAKATVAGLLDEIGFDAVDAVDAGTLDESWRQQPGSPSYGLSADAAGIARALAAASPERPAEFRG